MLLRFCSFTLLLFLSIKGTQTEFKNPSLPNINNRCNLLKIRKTTKFLFENVKIPFKKELEESDVEKTTHAQQRVQHFSDMLNTFSMNASIRSMTDNGGILERQRNQPHNLEKRESIENLLMNASAARERGNKHLDEKAREDAYRKTVAKAHPYAVAMLCVHRNESLSGTCSGSLLTLEWVLTAAHCLEDGIKHIIVYAGITNLSEAANILPEGGQVKLGEVWHRHPNYDTKIHFNDMGLIRLRGGGFKATDYVKTVKLSTKPWAKGYSRNCTVTGFGRVRIYEESPDDLVRKTQILHAEKPCPCERTDDRFSPNPNICIRTRKDFGLCSGDSGSGLVCDGEVRGVHSRTFPYKDLKACKIVKYGDNYDMTGLCGGVNSLNVLEDTYPFLDWINRVQLKSPTEGDTTAGVGHNRHKVQLLSAILGMSCSLLITSFQASYLRVKFYL